MNCKNGLVSVITPCYNGSRFISETIDSVLSQTYSNWEMIIVDDGSTDNSAEIVELYSKKDGRIRLIRQVNGGSAEARNHGIREAQGQYIALLDSDDLWKPEFLSEQIDFMKGKNARCVYSSYERIDENSIECLSPLICKRSVHYKDMLVRNYIGCLTGLYDCSANGKIFLHEELKSLRDDYAYWLDVVKVCGVAYGNQKVLASYRVLRNSTTGRKKKLIKTQYDFYRQYLKLNPIVSLLHTIQWGIAGLIHFSK